MAYGVRLHVWGDYACFTRPEMKVERVSYDIMTPSAARGVLDAIHWRPGVRWAVDRIHVLRPIRFESFRRNELGSKVSVSNVRKAMRSGNTGGLHSYISEDRQQRASSLLRDVGYVIEAHLAFTHAAKPDDTEGKHLSMFKRRASKGQCFHRPYLGTREFAADFALVEGEMPASSLPREQRNRDLGWMLHDIDHANGEPRFFRAQLRDGVVAVPPLHAAEVKA
ncbi:MAG: type I-C CRISPR-associated protein Cas5c [Gammaproteobacteria bacterium]|nr:type I-C CRISPR-associated protein Cas5c [Gammaproteobacteria bacterium]